MAAFPVSILVLSILVHDSRPVRPTRITSSGTPSNRRTRNPIKPRADQDTTGTQPIAMTRGDEWTIRRN
jgi:hypothetical protein